MCSPDQETAVTNILFNGFMSDLESTYFESNHNVELNRDIYIWHHICLTLLDPHLPSFCEKILKHQYDLYLY